MIAPGHALTLLSGVLEPGERVLYAIRPDIRVTIRNKLILWWIGVPLGVAMTSLYVTGRIPLSVAAPFLLIALALTLAPILLAIDTRYTVYAVTDRRALIVHSGLRPGSASCPFAQMDDKLEILTAGGRGGHVYFASNMPTRQRDVDYTGRIAFRDLADPHEAAAQIDAARKRA